MKWQYAIAFDDETPISLALASFDAEARTMLRACSASAYSFHSLLPGKTVSARDGHYPR